MGQYRDKRCNTEIKEEDTILFTDHEIQCPFCGYKDSIEKINELGGYLGDPEYDHDFYDNLEYNESYRVQCNKCKKEFYFELIGNVMQFKSYYNK